MSRNPKKSLEIPKTSLTNQKNSPTNPKDFTKKSKKFHRQILLLLLPVLLRLLLLLHLVLGGDKGSMVGWDKKSVGPLCFEFNFKYAPSSFQSHLEVTCSISKQPAVELQLQYSSLCQHCKVFYTAHPTWKSNLTIPLILYTVLEPYLRCHFIYVQPWELMCCKRSSVLLLALTTFIDSGGKNQCTSYQRCETSIAK